MFEGNILQPCQPRDQPQPPQQPQNRHTDNYQRLIQLSYQQYTFPGTVSLSSISETLNKDEGYSDYAQASDENSGWSHDHCSQWYTLYQQDKIEIRHDRKDSGVFVHDEEGVFSQISSNSKVIDHDFEAPEWHTTDFDDCEFDYGNMTIESRALALRSCPVGEDFFQMEIGSLMLPLPSFPRPLPLLS
ncbi:hypothetical protein BGZ76_005085 [Entomortierella beljakovae]|nr:hypothetical protein BGZ76_005085 [Entomortierella beljakovae]